MNTKKLLLITCFFISAFNLAYSQSISITNVGDVYYIPHNQSSITIRFSIIYYDLNRIDLANLRYRVNGGQWTPSNPQQGFLPDAVDINFANGTHTVEFQLLGYDWNVFLWRIYDTKTRSLSCIQQYSITVENSFGGGVVKVDGIIYNSPKQFIWNHGENHTLEAIDRQNFPENGINYIRVFQNWSGLSTASTLSTILSVNQNGTCRANFWKEFNINFQNSFTGVGNVGVIKVNQTQYNSPTLIFQVVEQNSINAEAVDQTLNGINYTFTNWSEAGGSNRNWTFNPNDHKTYTAYFSGTPQPPSIAFTLLKTSR
jgi:hypothetical protein